MARDETRSIDQDISAIVYDVAIIGAGIAGLTLAVQLLRSDPTLKVYVCDKRSYPYPVDKHKLGEALVEGGSHYLRDVIGVGDHLREHHIIKTGLRFYLPRENTPRIDERPEIGTDTSLPLTTYIIERYRFENHLVELARELGASVAHEQAVEAYEKVGESYCVSTAHGDERRTIAARWLVDASGRRAIVRKKLRLTEDSQHSCASSWFRIEKPIDPHDWSDRPEWRERVPASNRRNATNHLLGTGYWVWLIPIKTGATSIGIVTDFSIVPFPDISRLDHALAWLGKNLPELAQRISGDENKISGFGTTKNVSYSTKQMFSPDGWCLTGEAATFTDPLYSSGLELIAISNTMITHIVKCDKMGGEVAPVIGFMNDVYLLLYDVLMGFYRNMYQTFGNARVFSTKTAWDFTVYVSLPLGLLRYGKLFDPEFMQQFGPTLGRAAALTNKMQALFRAWAEMDDGDTPQFAPCHAKLETVDRLECLYRDHMPEKEAFLPLFQENVAILEETALEIFKRVTARLGISPDKPATNPYAISLNADSWEEDGLFAGPDVSIRDCVQRDVARFWA